MKKIAVVYHANCADGFGAGWVAWRRFREQADYLPVRQGDPPPNTTGYDVVYFLDYAPPRADVLRLSTMQTVIIIDHHKTAIADLTGLPDSLYRSLFLSNDHSAAVLTWLTFFPSEPVPSLLLAIEDRDLWRWEREGSREITAALDTYPKDFQQWGLLMESHETLRVVGERLVALQKAHVRDLVHEAQTAWMYVPNGPLVRFPAVNCNHMFASDVGHELLKAYPKAPFAACYRDVASGQRYWSLRSMDDRRDVEQIAKKLGGGGHRNAAGMHEEFPHQHIGIYRPYPYRDFAEVEG